MFKIRQKSGHPFFIIKTFFKEKFSNIDRIVLFGFPPFRSCCVRNWRSSCRIWTVLLRKKREQRGGK